eukprot:GHVN01049900.1.p1 GENE.GHVN01049900.1~~GHVN01049900.1.p1  ORF type:complete len:455 (-),score=33.92 GHVN01049900.1:2819-4183(-)
MTNQTRRTQHEHSVFAAYREDTSNWISSFVEEIRRTENIKAIRAMTSLVLLPKNARIHRKDVSSFCLLAFRRLVELGEYSFSLPLLAEMAEDDVELAIGFLCSLLLKQPKDGVLVFLFQNHRKHLQAFFERNILLHGSFTAYFDLLFYLREFEACLSLIDFYHKEIIGGYSMVEDSTGEIEAGLLLSKLIFDNYSELLPPSYNSKVPGLFLSECTTTKEAKATVERNCTLFSARRKLSGILKKNPLQITPGEISMYFMEALLYENCFLFLQGVSLSTEAFFRHLSFKYVDGQQRQPTNSEKEAFASCGISCSTENVSLSFSALIKHYLGKVSDEGYFLHKSIASEILSRSGNIRLPGWLEKVLFDNIPDRLFSLYLDTGRIEQAVEVGRHLVQTEMKYLSEKKASRWFPYQHNIERATYMGGECEGTKKLWSLYRDYCARLEEKGGPSYIKQMA